MSVAVNRDHCIDGALRCALPRWRPSLRVVPRMGGNGNENPTTDVRALAKMIVNDDVWKAEVDGEIRYCEGAGGLGNGQIEIFPKGNGVGEDGFGTGVALPFARASVPLDLDMRPAEAPFDWPASEWCR